MSLQNKIALLLLFAWCGQTAGAQDILQLWYPYQVNMLPACGNKAFEKNVPIITNSKKAVKLYSFKPDNNEFTLIYNGKEVREQDTISLTQTKPAILKARFKKMPANQDSLYFSFETSIDSMEIFKRGSIQLLFKEYAVSQIRFVADQEQVVELSKSCLDSIRVYYPFGGTETMIDLYNPQNLESPVRHIWYRIESNAKNYMTFSRKDIGRYYVRLSSCWTGDSFWLTIQ